PADEPTALPDADRFEQQLPASPDEADEVPGAETAAPEGSPVLLGGSEGDRLGQRLPGSSPGGRVLPPSGQAMPEGSEADRIEQALGVPGVDEDDYPHGAAD
ncbi:hypothetical protein HER39_20300, partial [Arthrobacter deserti]|nr:hypothetical protein [Arthrobacter deserti]